MDLLTIGAFARLTRLSPKALRLYDSVNLLAPAHVDQASGYRWYTPEQAERARLVALLRQLDMPLARIAELIGLPSDEQAAALAKYWSPGLGPEKPPATRTRPSGSRIWMWSLRGADISAVRVHCPVAGS